MIAVYVHPESLTVKEYEKVGQRLGETGAPETGRLHHSCFGEDGQLMIFDIWESEAAYGAFVEHLGPILEELGIKSSPPTVMPVVRLVQ